MKNLENGFTLIELLVVVSIVAILSSIGIAGYSEYRERAYTAVLESGLRAGISDMEVLIAGGEYTKDVSAFRRINANGSVQMNAAADELLPTARPSDNHYIWARAYSGCGGSDEDRYIVQSFHWNAKTWLRYDHNCNGTNNRFTWVKCPGSWFGRSC